MILSDPNGTFNPFGEIDTDQIILQLNVKQQLWKVQQGRVPEDYENCIWISEGSGRGLPRGGDIQKRDLRLK